MKYSLHSHMYLNVVGSNLHKPLFEQLTRHDVTSTSDCNMLSNSAVRFLNPSNLVKLSDGDVVAKKS